MSGTVHIPLEQAGGSAVRDVMMTEPRSVGPDTPMSEVRVTFASPSVKLMLVTDGERALLGRQASWPQGRFSTIAGFVEPGESLEDAVAREVMEETAVQVTGANYDSSQPWPFPSSLMIGFHATAEPGSPVRVSGELESAAWFTREQIESGGTMVPPSHAISYRLISAWLKGRS